MNTRTVNQFTLDGAVVPKARPRVTRRGTFLPQRYRDWKQQAIAALVSQKTISEPLEKVTISIELYGSHRGDLDNIAGAILDALVQSGIILDDRVSLVKALSIRHLDEKDKRAIVEIEKL